MNTHAFRPQESLDIQWCPGCGNFGILSALQMALAELGKDPLQTVLVSGIGQAAKTPQYVRAHYFNGLHGRALPVAEAIKVANPHLTVIAESGDGDTYGEGGNHWLHAIRRNSDITNIVHNNMIYGLTKGQASPTTPVGMKTPVQVYGVFEKPINPVAIAIAQGASLVARANIGNLQQAKEIFKQAITHRGYALVDVFQPCVVFNKVNTYQWYKEHTYTLPEEYDPTDREKALAVALEEDRFALGVLWRDPEAAHRPLFREGVHVYDEDDRPLFQRSHDPQKVHKLLDRYRLSEEG